MDVGTVFYEGCIGALPHNLLLQEGVSCMLEGKRCLKITYGTDHH